MSLQRTLLRSRAMKAFRPASQRFPLHAISTKPYVYEPSKNSYNLMRRKWDETREVYEPHSRSCSTMLEQASKARGIVEPQATSYTPWSFKETDATYNAHPEGFNAEDDKIREAKKTALDNVIDAGLPKRVARNLCAGGLPSSLLQLKDITDELKEHKEKQETAQWKAGYVIFASGFCFGGLYCCGLAYWWSPSVQMVKWPFGTVVV